MEVDTQQHDVTDLVRYTYDGQPSKVQDVFNELMMGRVFDSIQQKKVEVAQQFFNPQQEPEFYSDEDYTEEDTEDGENS